MRCLVQRVSQASVSINNKTTASIQKGLLLLVGFEQDDELTDLEWVAKKVSQLRIFSDQEGLMNLSLSDIDGEILVVSQFTLHAAIKKGNRPSFIKAAKPPIAIPLYERFKIILEDKHIGKVQSGEFGADMQVALVNDGPVTIWIDSKAKE